MNYIHARDLVSKLKKYHSMQLSFSSWSVSTQLKDISQIGKRIKACLKTPPTQVKTNMTFEKSTIFLRKYIFKCWSFQCQKSKNPPMQNPTLRGATGLHKLRFSFSFATGTGIWGCLANKKNTRFVCVCTNGMDRWIDRWIDTVDRFGFSCRFRFR